MKDRYIAQHPSGAQVGNPIQLMIADLLGSADAWRVVYDDTGNPVTLRILKGIEDNLRTLGAEIPVWMALLPAVPRR